ERQALAQTLAEIVERANGGRWSEAAASRRGLASDAAGKALAATKWSMPGPAGKALSEVGRLAAVQSDLGRLETALKKIDGDRQSALTILRELDLANLSAPLGDLARGLRGLIELPLAVSGL